MDIRRILWVFTLIAKVLLKLIDEMSDIFDGDPTDELPIEKQPVGPENVLTPGQRLDIATFRDECCKRP